MPTVLPPELIPPTLRRSRASSIHSQGSTGTGTGTPGEGALSPTSAQLVTDSKLNKNYYRLLIF